MNYIIKIFLNFNNILVCYSINLSRETFVIYKIRFINTILYKTNNTNFMRGLYTHPFTGSGQAAGCYLSTINLSIQVIQKLAFNIPVNVDIPLIERLSFLNLSI